MNKLWINRIIALITFMLCIYICEKFNLRPIVCFILSTFMIIGLSFVFAFIDELLK